MIQNKKAYFNYHIIDELETGLVLENDEIKSIRNNRVNLDGSYAKILFNEKGNPELYMVGAYFKSDLIDPYRTKKLLAHKKEIESLIGKTKEKGLTLIPLKIYFSKGKAKLLLGVGKGKKRVDKRELIKKRDAMKRINQNLKKRF